MNRASLYYRQVRLLVRLLPIIANESCFALKGGTAINMFVRELPAVKWKMINLEKVPADKHTKALKVLEKVRYA